MPKNNHTAIDWLKPPPEQEGLQRYVEVVRERFGLIALTVSLTLLIAVVYVVVAPKAYQAQSSLLVTPVNSSDPTLASLGLMSQSVDPTRNVETVAALSTNLDTAATAQQLLKTGESPNSLLAKVSAAPLAQADIVSITATAASPIAARNLANAFARATVQTRTVRLHQRIDAQIPQLEAQLSRTPAGSPAADSLGSTIAASQTLRKAPDPELSVLTLADTPTSPSSPRVALSIAAGILGGLVLGIGAAFAAQALDPRLRREAQLRRSYSLPILARIPREKGRSSDRPIRPSELSPVSSEAYRTLRASLGRVEPRVILVTGASVSEGKTTTAASLASSLAAAGKRVILIEADLRRPVLGNLFGVQIDNFGVVGVLIENVTLDQALVPTPLYGNNLRVLAADYEGGWIAELFSIPAADRMIEQARSLADYVIIDSPPLPEVVDALPMARHADDVLLVVRLGHTRLDRIRLLGELLAENNVRPTGFVVVGTSRPTRGAYHYHAASVTPGGGGDLEDQGGRSRLGLGRSRS